MGEILRIERNPKKFRKKFKNIQAEIQKTFRKKYNFFGVL